MTAWDEVIRNRLDSYRERLQSRPGMSDWELGCRRLGDELMRWIDESTESFSESPSRFLAADVGRENVQLPTADAETTRRRLELVIDTLVYHWLNEVDDVQLEATAAEDEPVHEGIALGERLREGLGRRKALSANEATATSEYAKLTGDPLHDVVLVDAIVARENRAIEYFTQKFGRAVEPILRRHADRYQDSPEDRWMTFVADFVTGADASNENHDIVAERVDEAGTDCHTEQRMQSGLPRIARYDGSAGLMKFVSISLVRELIRPTQRHWSLDDHLRHLTFEEQWNALTTVLFPERLDVIDALLTQLASREQRHDCPPEFRVKQVRDLLTAEEIDNWRQACNGLRQMHKRAMAKREQSSAAEVDGCDALLVELLTSALEKALDARERLVMLMCFHERQENIAIAQLLEISPGNATRARQRALKKILGFIDNRLDAGDPFAAQCRPCWQPIPNNMVRLSDLLYEALEQLPRAETGDAAPAESSAGGNAQ